MGLDTLDLSVLVAIVVALITYFSKGKLWAKEENFSEESSTSRDIAEVVHKTGKKAVVFYGSQTGTAEDYANKFSRELQSRFSIPTMCGDLADYDFDTLGSLQETPDFKFVIFLMATYGEGEPTDNANDFFEFLDSEPEISGLKFALFGLGNSTYEIFNGAGRKVNEKLLELGAQRIGEYGEGDDGKATLDEDYLAWKDCLFETLKDSLHMEEHDMQYQPGLECVERSDLSLSSVSLGEPTKNHVKGLNEGPFSHSNPYIAPIVKTQELFHSEDRHCTHVEFDFSDTSLKYSTGDHLAVWPSNSNENVSQFMRAFGIQDKADQVVELKSLDSTVHLPFPSPCTYESIVRHYLEISGPVSRQFLKSVVQFAPSNGVRAEITKLADDKNLFHETVTAKFLNIADILLQISSNQPWTTVPLTFLVELVPHLQPRYYSISSSSLSEKQIVHITAVVEDFVPENSTRHVTGVATNLLWNIELAQNGKSGKPHATYDLEGPRSRFSPYKLPVHIRRSTFKLPSNPATPVILVGPGTGVAPLRGFVRDRVHQAKNGVKVGKILLFFGCRFSKEDFLYKEEWPEYQKVLGDSFEMVSAFSRETSVKSYVQHKMLECSQRVDELIKEGAFLYVCGDASRMARDVQATISQILVAERKVTEDVAADMVRNLKTTNRYQEDIW